MKASNDETTLFGDDDGSPRELNWSYTTDEIARWNQIWPQAVSMAWTDDGFKKALIEDARGALERRLGYTFPAEITLEVKDATGFVGTTSSGEKATAGYQPTDDGAGIGHWLVPATNVTLWLPPAPEDMDLQAVALAAYGTRGHIYPFTCCI